MHGVIFVVHGFSEWW